MVDILHRVGVAAPPQAVLSALTTLDGLQGWWVSSIDGAAGKGETFVRARGPRRGSPSRSFRASCLNRVPYRVFTLT